MDVETSDADAAPRTCTDDGFCHTVLPERLSLQGVWGDGTGVVWAVSEEGKVVRWDGKAWTVHTTIDGAIHAIWGSGPTDLWIGGDSGLLHGEGPSSSQITFTQIPSDSRIPITSIHGFGPNDVWAVGGNSDGVVEESRVIHYTGPTADPAEAWKLDPVSSQAVVLSRVWGPSKDDLWLGGTTMLSDPQGGVVLHGTPDGAGGLTFEPVMVSEGRSSFLNITGGQVLSRPFVVGNDWLDLGMVWGGPTADEPSVRWDYEVLQWGLNALWGRSDSDIWIAGISGRVRHWDGTAWTLARVTLDKFPFTNDLNAIWGMASGEMWIVGANTALRRVPSLVQGDH
ncbi:hypothetical protein AKJ09_07088 [Labilithrix luteola]|uniref:Type IV fimbrial biogenesis protein PilY1 n=1 Tax=Labilithrix luteola TaxID=1391654 RepID=A0A0K1Q4U5_9BACT|nr:hypothetical protein AKJ09_07088 [Labilithrix luteola]